MLEPPVGDVDPPREPDIAQPERVLDELPQRRRAACLADPARMQPDRHHLRIAGQPLAAQLVGSPLADVEEVGRPAEPLWENVAAVVVDERVRHHEVPVAVHLGEVGEVVVVGIRVVDEAALLDEQLARVDARSVAAVPAERALPRRPLERLDRPLDVLPLLVAAEQPVLLPAPAVAARLVPRFLDPFAYLRIPLQRDRGGVERRLDAVLVEHAEQAPDAGPAAVLVNRLGAEVAVLRIHEVRDLGEPLVAAVPGRLRVLRALLVVDAEADDRLGVVRPEDLRWATPVADVVPLRPGDVLIDELHVSPFALTSPGSRRCQSVACWYAAPALSTVASLSGAAASCTPTGSPSAEKPHGTLSAGRPARLQPYVNLTSRWVVSIISESAGGAVVPAVGVSRMSTCSSTDATRRRQPRASWRARP